MSVLLAGCAAVNDELSARGDLLMEQNKWEEAAEAYQAALKSKPFDATLQAKLKSAKGLAASYYNEQGQAALKERNLPLAIEAFKRALILEPSNPAHQAALGKAFSYKEAQDRLTIGLKLLKGGRLEDAAEALERALELDPDLKAAQDGLVQLAEKQKAAQFPPAGSHQPITLKFQNARTKEVFEALARSGGINVLFDKDVKDDPITIFIKDASFEEALQLILTTQSLFARRVAADTILVIPKTKQKLDQYQDLLIRTFYLSTSKAKDMVNLLRTMLETKRIFVNEDLNAIVMRDTADKVKLAERIIMANDRKPGEVLFEIEVMEVDKAKTQTLGTNLAKTLGAGLFPPGTDSAKTTVTGGLATFNFQQLRSLNPTSYLFTIPSSLLFNFFQSNADTKTLANPKIRVVNNKQAKVNIGDKVPILLSNTNTNVPTGGAAATTTVNTITSIEYKDTGVKLTIEPNIHLNNDVTFKLTLEVTSLGNLQDLGNGQRQFTFSTRTAETTLSLKDGESVVIGGLIQDQDRTTVEKVPGLGDIPVLGEVFKATTKTVSSTEVILTIAPHIVRSLEMPGVDDQAFWSGTEEAYGLKQLFGEAGLGTAVSAPALSRPAPAPVAPPVTAPAPPPAPSSSESPAPPSVLPAVLSILPPDRTLLVGQDARLDVLATDVAGLVEGTLTVTYDPKVLEFRQAIEGEFLKRDGAATVSTEVNPATGTVIVRLKRAEGALGVSGAGVLVTLAFTGKGSGLSSVAVQTAQLLNAGKAALPNTGGQGVVRVQ